MSSLNEGITYLLYSLLWKTIRLLPERMAYGVFDLFAKWAYRRNGRRVRRLRSNYKKILAESKEKDLEKQVKVGLANAMRYWCDTFRISDWSNARVQETVTTENSELLINGAKSGHGVIVALPHAGNWDHAGFFFCSQGIEVNTVAEHLKPDRLFRKFLAHRERMGIRVLDLNQSVTEELIERLNEGKLVALVADRDLSRSGIDVVFFGSIARMPPGPALLAYRTSAELITAYVSYTPKGIHIKFSGPFEVIRENPERDEVLRVTQQIAKQFEQDISADLTSWHMQQRIFIEQGA